jgi:hypothetical protein
MPKNTKTSVGSTVLSTAKGTPILYKILEYCSIAWFQLSHQIKNHQGNVKYCYYLTPAERTNVKLLKISQIMNN